SFVGCFAALLQKTELFESFQCFRDCRPCQPAAAEYFALLAGIALLAHGEADAPFALVNPVLPTEDVPDGERQNHKLLCRQDRHGAVDIVIRQLKTVGEQTTHARPRCNRRMWSRTVSLFPMVNARCGSYPNCFAMW